MSLRVLEVIFDRRGRDGFREYERSTTTTKSCLALQIFVSAWPAGQSSFSTATPMMAAGRSSQLSTPRILFAISGGNGLLGQT